MIPLSSLTAAQRVTYEETLVSSHRVSFRVDFLDQNEANPTTVSGPSVEPVSEYTIESGQVDVDADAGVTRTATLSILDPNKKFKWDPSAPANGLWHGRFISIAYCVFVEDSPDDWVEVPVFFGPVTNVDLSGEYIEIQAAGKEILFQPPTFLDLSGIQGQQTLDYRAAIETLFRAAGELKFRLSATAVTWHTVTTVIPPDRRRRLPGSTVTTDVAVYPTNPFAMDEGSQAGVNAWELLRDAADKQGLTMHYDAEGFLVLEVKGDPNASPSWVFRDGDSGSVITRPKISHNLSDFVNEVHVMADGWPGPTKAALDPNHPLSKESLSRNGKQRVMRDTIEVGPETLQSSAATVASNRLKEAELVQKQVEFNSLVIPHLEQNDVVRIESEIANENFLLRRFTIPLTVSDTMSISHNQRIHSAEGLVLTEPTVIPYPGNAAVSPGGGYPGNAANPLDPGAPYMPGEAGGPPLPDPMQGVQILPDRHSHRHGPERPGNRAKHHGEWHTRDHVHQHDV